MHENSVIKKKNTKEKKNHAVFNAAGTPIREPLARTEEKNRQFVAIFAFF